MRRLLLVAALVLSAAFAIGACSAAHSGYPTQSCKTDSDCYLGEKCMNNSICITVGADLSVSRATIDMSGPADVDGGSS